MGLMAMFLRDNAYTAVSVLLIAVCALAVNTSRGSVAPPTSTMTGAFMLHNPDNCVSETLKVMHENCSLEGFSVT